MKQETKGMIIGSALIVVSGVLAFFGARVESAFKVWLVMVSVLAGAVGFVVSVYSIIRYLE